MKYKIPFIKPSFPSAFALAKDYKDIIKRNWFTNFGPIETRFSKDASIFISPQAHATTIANATQGIDAAISILFNNKKNYVIIPSFTFAAGADIIIRNGYTPILIDINESSWQPDIIQANNAITKFKNDVAGIVLCNIFGVGNQTVSEWEKLAKAHKIPIIIDTAAGFGSNYSDDERTGLRGDCEIFSLHATKPFSVGEGGLVTSNNNKLIEKIRSWQNFGFESDRNIHIIGTNAKFQEINAAIALRQLKRFPSRLLARQKNLMIYKRQLADIPNISFQPNDERSSVAFVSIKVGSEVLANNIQKRLSSSGVEVRKYYAPLHFQSIIKKRSLTPFVLSNTEDLYAKILSLPLHDDMSKSKIKYICDIIRLVSSGK